MMVVEFTKTGFKSYNPGETASFEDGPDDIAPELIRRGWAKPRPDITPVDPEKERAEQAKEHLRERGEFAKFMGSSQNDGTEKVLRDLVIALRERK